MENSSNVPPLPPSAAPASAPAPGKRLKLLINLFKIAIAVLGLWYVWNKLTWNDVATLKAGPPGLRNVEFVNDTDVEVLGSTTLAHGTVEYRIRFGSKPVKLRVEVGGAVREVEMVIQDGVLIPETKEELNLTREMVVPAERLVEKKVEDSVKGEIVQPGVRSVLITAGGKWPLLLGAWGLLVIPFFVTAIRWRNLMRPQGLEMPLGKCLQLTFVGQFYSIMLPGITGGDLVKIVYAARLTGSKTKSFITIVLDRVIGLVALMVIAGTSAGVQLWVNYKNHVTDNTLANVFLLIIVLLVGLAAGATVYFSHRLRRKLGIQWFVEHLGSASQEEGRAKLEHLFRVFNCLVLLGAVMGAGVLVLLRWGIHLPWAMRNELFVIYGGLTAMGVAALAAAGGLVMHNLLIQRFRPRIGKLAEGIVGVDETLHVYRGHFGLLVWAFFISLISQMTLPLSAWLCGMALGMNAPMTHYLAYVPVVVLAASMPISPPQGFGVMEGLLAHFFRFSARAGQAFMLVQGIRFLPMLWNLVGGYWVVTGRYSRNRPANSE